MDVSLAFHLIGMAMWLLGLMILTSFMRVFSGEARISEPARRSCKKMLFGFVIPGLCISVISGIYQLSLKGMAFYMTQGWFHTKLTLVIVLLVVSGLVIVDGLKMQRGEAVKRSRISTLHGLSGLLLILIVFITMLGRNNI